MTAIDDFLIDLPADERNMATQLCKIIRNTSDRLTEKLAYGVPYFYGKSRICFIWPASKEAITIEHGVMLGFCSGHLLSNANGLLQSRGRKEVWDVVYTDICQINERAIRENLNEAILLDAAIAASKKRK
jgi:Domain of unknown function (DU1801)